tara:strand:- start:18279 stop:18749 length:471 start_codon:yes stop_codon:yes gene_type:complete
MAFSQETIEFIKKECQRYETRRSAILPCLYRAQKEDPNNQVTPEAVAEMATLMELPEVQINEVLHFYTMYNKKPVGKLHVQVCTNISCSMNGGREMAEHLCKEFNVNYEEVSSDGRYTISRVECLGSCDTAPMMQVNDKYHENLTKEEAVKLLKDM